MTRLIINRAKAKYDISPNENGNLLKASGNFEILINNNFIINSDNSIIDKNKSFLETTGNVVLIYSLRKIRIEANKIN